MAQKTNFLNIVKEILKQCSSENITVNLDLVVYLLELKLLQRSKNFSFLVHNPDVAETLINESVNDLKQNNFFTRILTLQLFRQKKYQPRDIIKKIHHERVLKNALPIMSEISEDSSVKDKEHLYKKIVIFVIMFAGLGSPTQPSVIKETQAALHSIFRTTEVENYLSLPKYTKEQQLIEFARLITGILLFNKDCKKGGEGMDDLPLILAQGVRATKERLFSFKDQLDQKIEKLASALLSCYPENESLKEKNECSKRETSVSLPQGFENENLEECKTLLIYYRHIENYLNELIKDLEKSFATVDELVERLQHSLLQVHNVVRYRVAVATAQVFPLFLQLSDIWVEMQEEIDILSEINNNFLDLTLATKLNVSASLETTLSTETLPSENDQIKDSVDFYPGVKVCSISSVPSQEFLQYNGFCAWTLAHTEGVLLTANITIGIIQFSNRFYSFSSAMAAYNWALNPYYFIKTVVKVARDRLELVKFLNLDIDLFDAVNVEEETKPTTSNTEVQTVLHPLDSFINKNYTYSEWELKRRAMKLASLTRCQTKSQQTTQKSCFRREMAVQVTPCKSIGVQTTRDGFCRHPSVPKFAWRLKTELPECFMPSLELRFTGK